MSSVQERHYLLTWFIPCRLLPERYYFYGSTDKFILLFNFHDILKGRERYINNGVEVEPAYSPLKCSKDDNRKVCQFPFVHNGEVKWDCVEAKAEDGWTRRPAKVCNVKPSKIIQEFRDLSGFEECGECSPSVKNGVNHFQGFPLLNHAGVHFYSRLDSKDDCQTLCDLSRGCNFFNYDFTFKKCYLKYGVGIKVSSVGVYFGSKTVKGCFQDHQYI